MTWGSEIRIWNREGTRYLVNDDWSALRIDGEGNTPATPGALVNVVHIRFGVRTAFLRMHAQGWYEFELLECPPSKLRWIKGTMHPAPELREPWHRPGWLEKTLTDVRRGLMQKGIVPTGPAIQYQHTSITGMVTINTQHGRLWIKAIPKIFSHESSVIRWIAQHRPDVVPEVILATDDWWISKDIPAAADTLPDCDYLEVMSSIQQDSIDKQDELLGLGCPDRSIEELTTRFAAILNRNDLLDKDRQATLKKVLPRLDRTCIEIATLGFPRTLVHGDLRPSNVLWTGKTWVIIDWTDACLSHPFIDLATVLYAAPSEERIRRSSIFAKCWVPFVGSKATERAIASASVLGAAHQAVSYGRFLDYIDTSAGDRCGGKENSIWLCRWVDRVSQCLQEDV